MVNHQLLTENGDPASIESIEIEEGLVVFALVLVVESSESRKSSEFRDYLSRRNVIIETVVRP